MSGDGWQKKGSGAGWQDQSKADRQKVTLTPCRKKRQKKKGSMQASVVWHAVSVPIMSWHSLFFNWLWKNTLFSRWSVDLGWDEHLLFWTGLYFGAGRRQRRRRGADNITDTRQTGRDVHRAAGPWREKSARVGTGRVLPARSRAETAARLLPGFLGLQTVINGSCHEIST